MIVHEEMGRWKVRGLDDGVLGGMVISAPTVLNFGSPALKQKVCYITSKNVRLNHDLYDCI
jgi:hypothetical protein